MKYSKIRYVSWFFIPLFFTACASINTVQFSGESATYGGDNILRDDVFAEIQRIEQLTQQCQKITAVNSQIIQAQQIDSLWQVQELWTISACGNSRDYPLELRQDAKGETDFTIRVTP